MSSKSKKSVAKAETFTQSKGQETLKQASSVTIESAAKKVTEAQLAIGKTLSDVTNQLQNQLQELTTVTQAVELKKAELESIYGKEQVLKNIDELNVEFETNKQTFEDAKLNLERERQQEAADFQFNLDQHRKNDEAQYEEQRRLVRISHRDEDEARNKAFLAREEELKKRETELTELRAKVAAFPEELKKESEKAAAIATNSVKREYEHRIQLLSKDIETKDAISQNKEAALNQRIATQDRVIAELTHQVTTAQAKVAEIAKDALSAASATKSLADVQTVLQTQSNGASPRKA